MCTRLKLTFSKEGLGNDYEGWSGEKWHDIQRSTIDLRLEM